MWSDGKILRSAARMMRAKAPIQFRLAAATLFVAAFALSTMGLFAWRVVQDAKRQFVTNTAVHVILVNSRSLGEQDLPRPVQWQDRQRIQEILDQSLSDAGARAWNVYQINFGITDSEGRADWVESVDPGAASLLGLAQMRDDTAYTTSSKASRLILYVPVVRQTQGGYESDRRIPMTLTRVEQIPRQAPLMALSSALNADSPNGRPLFVSYDAYRTILERAFGQPFPGVIRALERGQDFGIEPVASVAVYIPHLTDVDQVARILTAHHYNVAYALGAFQQLSSTWRTAARMAFGFILVTVVAMYLGAWLAFRSDLRRSRKDLGILRHFGFSAQEVARIYHLKFRGMFLTCAGSTALYTLVAGALVFRLPWYACVVLACAVAACVGLMSMANASAARKTAALHLPHLLRFSKEME